MGNEKMAPGCLLVYGVPIWNDSSYDYRFWVEVMFRVGLEKEGESKNIYSALSPKNHVLFFNEEETTNLPF